MKILLFLLLSTICFASWERPPEWWLIQKNNVFYLRVENKPVTINLDGTIDCNDVSFDVLTQEEALTKIARNWLSDEMPRMNLKALAVLATGWVGKPKPPVVEPEPVSFWVSITPFGTKYHEFWCRYAATGYPVDIIWAIQHEYTPCAVCKPLFYDENE